MRKHARHIISVLILSGFLALGFLIPSPARVAKADGTEAASYNPCGNLPSDAQQACKNCFGDVSNPKGFWTAIGCVPTDPVSATRDLLDFMLGVGGFFVVVQILIGSFQLLTSRGNTQALQQARERITNSVIALLFIVFSVTILEFVGVTILHLPGFFDSNASTTK